MDVMNVVLILGKRLVDNVITAEGRSRVDALINLIDDKDLAPEAVIFCGGITQGQTESEARAMYRYFDSRCAQIRPFLPHVLLEDKSTNTIENIRNAAEKLIESQLCRKEHRVKVVLISNDYHLKRIFEIQTLMDEQGLLAVLERQCADTGLKIEIERSIDNHYPVPYPHSNRLAQVFLLLDELTTYRVYLEGVTADVFSRPLEKVRQQPYLIASDALVQLATLVTKENDVKDLAQIKRAVELTTPQLSDAETLAQLKLLDTALTRLNRRFDPERHVF